MKKVLSTLLAGAMVASMGASAFAWVNTKPDGDTDLEKIKSYTDGATLYNGIVEHKDYATDVSDSHRAVVKMGTVFAQEKPEFRIDLRTDMFGATAETTGSSEVFYVVNVDAMKKKGILSSTSSYSSLEEISNYLTATGRNLDYALDTYKTAAEVKYDAAVDALAKTTFTTAADFVVDGANSATVTLTTNKTMVTNWQEEINKTISGLNAKALAVGEEQASIMFNHYKKNGFVTTSTSSALAFTNYIGVEAQGLLNTANVTFTNANPAALLAPQEAVINKANADTKAGKADKATDKATFVINKVADDFNLRAVTGGNYINTEAVGKVVRNLTSEEIQRSRISLVTQMKGDSSPFKSADIDRSTGQVVVKLKDEWVPSASNKFAVDFEMLMYLKIADKSFADDTVTITGTLKNKEIDVYSNMDYVDLSDGTVAIPREFNKAISVNVGNGVTIHTKMFKDKKYYGISSRNGDEEATQVLRAHKEVSNVVTMKVFGLNNDNDNVTFGNDYADYYVYDANMNYLGRGTDKVSFSTKYYFADSEIEFEEEEGEDEDPEEEEPADGDEGDANEAPASTGGDATQSPNVNNNPGTGR